MDKILIIDQVIPIIKRIKKSCKNLDLYFLEANSEYEAVNMFIENINEIKIVIVDVSMNNFDGFRILKKIRTINKNVKIIVLTSLNTRKYFVNCLKIGVDDYILKPFENEFILNRILLALPKSEVEIKFAGDNALKEYFDQYYSITLENETKLVVLLGVFYKKMIDNSMKLINNAEVNLELFKSINDIFPDNSIFTMYKKQSYIGIISDTDVAIINEFIKKINSKIEFQNINFTFIYNILPDIEDDLLGYYDVINKLEEKMLK
ncbi:MAG: response regulator, partial [Bacillota bacterium]|nr:response regulator [Bacillota bacterium]